MAWDGAHNQVLMLDAGSGREQVTAANTWSWDGSGWVHHPRTVEPPTGVDLVHTAAYDPSRRAVVDVVSDVSNPRAAADVWTWGGKAWKQLDTVGAPAVRNGALGYDEARKQLILVGQDANGSGSLTTWVLHGSTWQQIPSLADADGPLQVVFDHATHRLLLFPAVYSPAAPPPCGGGDCPGWVPPLCFGCAVHPLAWIGDSWVVTDMTARFGTVVADPGGDGLLELVPSDDGTRGVWRWDGRSWSRIAGLPLPRNVGGWSVAPDLDVHQVVVFGGDEVNTGWNPVEKTLDQTWTFDGQTWSLRSGKPVPKLPPPATPPPPPPCTSGPATLQAELTPAGDISLQLHIPIAGAPGHCASVPASLRIEASSGMLLPLQPNPAILATDTFVADSTAFASGTWSNWCGQRYGVVVHLVGPGFDVAQRVTAPPTCRAIRMPSTVRIFRPVMIP